MLSIDELANGMPFILKLHDAQGIATQWVESLRGPTARRWYDIYRNSDWTALRAEAASIFHNSVTVEEAEKSRRAGRCIVIRTDAVNANDLLHAAVSESAVRESAVSDSGVSQSAIAGGSV